jgi:hypothetical protein
MKRKLALIGTLVLGLVLGGIIGAAGKTHTVTRTTTVAETTTVVHAKSVVPAACRNAIAEARVVDLEAGKAFGVAALFPPLVGEAAKAGVAQNVQQIDAIAGRLRSGSAKLAAIAPRFQAAAAAFVTKAAACR